MFYQRRFPKCVENSKIPLLKKGKKSTGETSLIRPIRFLHTIGKLLEDIILARLKKGLTKMEVNLHKRICILEGKIYASNISRSLNTAECSRKRAKRIINYMPQSPWTLKMTLILRHGKHYRKNCGR